MSSLSGRLGPRLGPGVGGPLVQRAKFKPPSGIGRALAKRLSMPGSKMDVSVGVKARLGPVRGPRDDERFSSSSANLDTRRKDARGSIFDARRKLQEDSPASPVLVKMSSGKMVGGMRSDSINSKNPKSPTFVSRKYSRSPNRHGAKAVVALDADRGLTVRVENKSRNKEDSAMFRGRSSRAIRPPANTANKYNEHDDRIERHGRAISDEERNARRLGIKIKGRRPQRHSDEMEVDSSDGGGGDVYSASLMYTRTTTHHHHHHHHGPSPPPPAASHYPPEYAVYPPTQKSPPFSRQLIHRSSSQTSGDYRGKAYFSEEEYPARYASPPPPPTPPSFHPRYKYTERSLSPAPLPALATKRANLEILHAKLPKSKKTTVKASKANKVPKVVQRKIISKAKVKSAKIRGASRTVKSKPHKVKVSSVRKSSSAITISSSSDSSNESSSSSSSSSSCDSEDNEGSEGYKLPPERVLPRPHKQVLDQEVLENIAVLQGKDPGYKSGPGPGVKNLQFVPSKTNKSLNQRFTASELQR